MFTGWRFRRGLRSLASSDHESLRAYAACDWPQGSTPVGEARFVALDFELDGLERDAHLLQAGWVAFDARGIPLAGARSSDVRSTRELDAKAVTVHGIGEGRAREGVPVGTVLEELLPALAGRIVIAHGAEIEQRCLARSTRAVFGQAVPVRSICTLALERKLNPHLAGSEPYRLGEARARYNLPPHDQHDALADAIGAAELFMAQLSRLPPDTRLGTLEALRVRH